MADKRIIEQTATSEVFVDDWLVKDSSTEGTTKIRPSNLKDYIAAGLVPETMVADEYVTTSTYDSGDICIYEGVLYKALEDDITGDWDSTKWDAITISSELENSGTGNVTDVYVNGVSVVDEGVAEITVPEDAEDIAYDNTTSGLTADNVQDAIDEEVDALGDEVTLREELESATKVYGTPKNLPQAIATFTDGSALPMPNLKVGIEPVQDLHGYDYPWVGGSGKNKLPLTVDRIKANNTNGTWNGNVYTESGVTFTLKTNEGGNITGIKVNGTASANVYLMLSQNELNYITFDGSYVVSGCSNGSSTTYALQVYSNESSGVRIDNFNEGNYIQSSNSSYTVKSVILVIRSGYTASNLMFYPMIRLASVTDVTFEPYSNICPISGWTEANVSVCGKNLFDKTTNVLNGYMTSGGTFRASNSGEKTFYCKVPKGTITMGKPVGTSVLRGVLFDSIPSNNDVGYEVLQYESNAKQTFTTTKETYYVCYCYNNTGETNTWQSVLDSIQVEIGSSATTYEPYNGHTYTIQFTDAQGNPITVYGGECDVVNGVLTVDRVKTVITKDSSIQYRSSGRALTFVSNGYKTVTMGGVNVICDKLKSAYYSNYDSAQNGEIASVSGSTAQTGISFKISDSITSLDELKAWLTDNPLTIVTNLATPITYQLTPTQVKSLLGSINVWADCGNIKELTYTRNLNITINDLISRVEALEG